MLYISSEVQNEDDNKTDAFSYRNFALQSKMYDMLNQVPYSLYALSNSFYEVCVEFIREFIASISSDSPSFDKIIKYKKNN